MSNKTTTMHWKKSDAEKSHFHDVQHVTPQNMNFALNLRDREVPTWHKFKPRTVDTTSRITGVNADTKQKAQVISHEQILFQENTDNPCEMPACTEMLSKLVSMNDEIREMKELISKLRVVYEDYEDLTSSEKVQKELAQTNIVLNQVLDKLNAKIKVLQSERYRATSTRSNLQAQVAKAQKIFEHLLNPHKPKNHQHDTESPSFDAEAALQRLHSHRKHPGTFEPNGRALGRVWSCCLGDSHSVIGCDDKSVGVRSLLALKPQDSFKPSRMMSKELGYKEKLMNEEAELDRLTTIQALNKGYRDSRYEELRKMHSVTKHTIPESGLISDIMPKVDVEVCTSMSTTKSTASFMKRGIMKRYEAKLQDKMERARSPGVNPTKHRPNSSHVGRAQAHGHGLSAKTRHDQPDHNLHKPPYPHGHYNDQHDIHKHDKDSVVEEPQHLNTYTDEDLAQTIMRHGQVIPERHHSKFVSEVRTQRRAFVMTALSHESLRAAKTESYCHPFYQPRTLNGDQILQRAKGIFSGPDVGVQRQFTGTSIRRNGGRPLTAPAGPHMFISSTTATTACNQYSAKSSAV